MTGNSNGWNQIRELLKLEIKTPAQCGRFDSAEADHKKEKRK